MLSLATLERATLRELAEFYNQHAERPVKRFTDKKAAMRRVKAILETLPGDPVRSKAVKASWKNEEVAKKRMHRQRVEVDGVEYKSVAAAYRALSIDLKDHIQFRMYLKDEPPGTVVKNHGHEWRMLDHG